MRTDGRMRRILDQHGLFVVIFLVATLLQAPKLFHIKEYVLLSQDYNPIHFGHLYYENDIPDADDSEVGENRRTFSLSSANFWIPLIFYKLGIPFEFFVGLHLLLGFPSLLACLYFLSIVLFKDKLFGIFSSLLFCLNEFWIFKLNIGYPILFFRGYYYNDITYTFLILSILFILKNKYQYAGLFSIITMLFNVTLGINIVGLFLFHLVMTKRLWKIERNTLHALILILIGIVLSFFMIKMSTPINNPAPEQAREFAILAYSHIAPHIQNPLKYFKATAFLLIMIIYAYSFERHIRLRIKGYICKEFQEMSRTVLLFFIFQGLFAYWVLYINIPNLFIMISPSKTYILCTFYISIYVAYSIYDTFSLSKWIALFFIVIALFNLTSFTRGYPADRMWYIASTIMAINLIFYLFHKNTPVKRQISTPGQVRKAFLMRFPHVARPFVDAEWARVCRHTLILAFGIIFCFIHIANKAEKLYNRSKLKVAESFYDIQLQINNKIEKNAIFVPYRLPETNINFYGPFGNWALRTYSRRGALNISSVGRNAYFNSMERHLNEEKFYMAAGIDLWKDIQKESMDYKKSDKLLFYTGISLYPSLRISNSTPLWDILTNKTNRMEKYMNSLNLDGFIGYARKIGATHVIVSKDPGIEIAGYPVILGNAYFSVIKI